MKILPDDTAAIIIDVQDNLMNDMWNSYECEDRMIRLVKGLHILQIPTIVVQQDTATFGGSLLSVCEAAGTTEYFEKKTFSCCAEKKIMDFLLKLKKRNVLIMGTEAHVCVLLTGIDLKAAGFQPVIVADAVTSRSAADMNIGIERAVQEGILVTTSESVLYALTMSSNHPKFKEISELIK